MAVYEEDVQDLGDSLLTQVNNRLYMLFCRLLQRLYNGVIDAKCDVTGNNWLLVLFNKFISKSVVYIRLVFFFLIN